jgi:hypothetical protein
LTIDKVVLQLKVPPHWHFVRSVMFEVSEFQEIFHINLAKLPVIIDAALQAGEESLAHEILGSLTQLSKEKPELFRSCWHPLFELLRTACATVDLEESIKSLLLETCVALLTDNRSAVFCSNPTSRTQILDLILNMMVEIDVDVDMNFFYTPPTRQ